MPMPSRTHSRVTNAMQATKLARAMVTKYGMSSSMGPTAIAYEDNGRSLSSETRAAVESEVSDHSPAGAFPRI